jgi:hypothetical protein
MKNVHLAFPNRIDPATLSGGSWLSTLPLNNLKNPRLSRQARTVDATNASTKFVIDLGQARNVEVVALIAHNLSANAQVRIKANSTNSFTTPGFDSGWVEMWPEGFLSGGKLEWEDDNFWLGSLSEEAAAGYKTPFSYFLTASISYQYWQVEIDDAANPDGYFSLGRCFIGPVFVPTHNMSYGTGLSVNDATAFETSLSGEEFYDTRQRYRTYAFSLDFLSEEEAYADILDMQRLMGTSGEIFVNGDPDDETNKPRRSFLARLASTAPIVHQHALLFSAQINLKEVL